MAARRSPGVASSCVSVAWARLPSLLLAKVTFAYSVPVTGRLPTSRSSEPAVRLTNVCYLVNASKDNENADRQKWALADIRWPTEFGTVMLDHLMQCFLSNQGLAVACFS